MTTETFSIYSLRTVAITQHQWIALAATSIEDDLTISAVSDARNENLKTLHRILADQPSTKLGRGTAWHDPTPGMKVTIRETVIKHDLVTGELIYEDEMAEYNISYSNMNPEED